MESSDRRTKVDDETVSITVVTPWQAASNEERSFRSPSTSATPAFLSFSTLAGTLEALTRPRTGLPAAASILQISLPNKPVAPATRFMSPPRVVHLVCYVRAEFPNPGGTRLLKRASRSRCATYGVADFFSNGSFCSWFISRARSTCLARPAGSWRVRRIQTDYTLHHL